MGGKGTYKRAVADLRKKAQVAKISWGPILGKMKR